MANMKMKRPALAEISKNTELAPKDSVYSFVKPNEINDYPSNDVLHFDIRKQTSTKLSEICLSTWFQLPSSKFGVLYDLRSITIHKERFKVRDSRNDTLKLSEEMPCPFIKTTKTLRTILDREYPDGAGLFYIREVFEPHDLDFPWSSTSSHRIVEASRITEKQMNRLRLMILTPKRLEVLSSYTAFFMDEYSKNPPYQGILNHFETFKKKYSKLRDYKNKFDILFCYTSCLHNFDKWLYHTGESNQRQYVIRGLASRWKYLLSSCNHQEIGIDTEFSLPAIQTLLASFRWKVKKAPAFDEPSMEFKFH